jgi:catechol 2,3-dioxygenase-like lactoylglutathione lyase family enzyme
MQSKMAPWAFVLAVPDMSRSAEYFRDVLGFRTSWEDASDGDWSKGATFG